MADHLAIWRLKLAGADSWKNWKFTGGPAGWLARFVFGKQGLC